jgi:hypothetical protein
MRKGLSAVAIAVTSLSLGAPAGAQDESAFSCRASAARVTVGPSTTEPIRANAGEAPCSSQSSAVVSETTAGPVTAQAVAAFTSRTPAGAGALASIAKGTAVLGPLTVSVEIAVAEASAACVGTSPKLSGKSRVVGVTVNGNPITLPPGDAPAEIPLGPLGTIFLNHEAADAARLVRRAVWVSSPAGEAVFGEAAAGAKADACTPTEGAAMGPACPTGSTYDPTRNACVIRESSSSSTSTVVSQPYGGPSGGTVITLAEARAQFKSLCLKGAGSNYAIVGTSGKDNITGTNAKDRILLLDGRDKAEGGRGNDCIDGGKGTDTMSGALGADRIIGGAGNDHLIGGSHADNLSGGTGADTINSGFGKDRINGGSGSDKINISVAGPAAKTVKCGKGRDKIRVNRNEKKRAKKGRCERIYVIR